MFRKIVSGIGVAVAACGIALGATGTATAAPAVNESAASAPLSAQSTWVYVTWFHPNQGYLCPMYANTNYPGHGYRCSQPYPGGMVELWVQF